MNMPGFTAEVTVYKTREFYRTVGNGTLFTGAIVPQLISSGSLGISACKIACDCCHDSICGSWISCAICGACKGRDLSVFG